jgi:hypothetical protein
VHHHPVHHQPLSGPGAPFGDSPHRLLTSAHLEEALLFESDLDASLEPSADDVHEALLVGIVVEPAEMVLPRRVAAVPPMLLSASHPASGCIRIGILLETRPLRLASSLFPLRSV